ncbi:MAG: hypothetical protein CMP70_04105 [Flavobacteriales bacterium]|nr:hypothetical protein [Flavobacteriales bacterium]|tara:strand:+ start:1398 stop:1802 length:405 start_codon:yes stop_codon:yes gene_type:complete
MELVNCTENYWEFVRKLRMDPRVEKGFVEKKKITKQMQKDYMKKYSNFYRIALVDKTNKKEIVKEPAGFIGVINNDIRICTHPNYQGIGVGKFMINSAMKIWPKATSKIKIENKSSLKLFESCGFNKKYYILEK